MATASPLASFGDLQGRLARETVRHLSNASASWWPGGVGAGPSVDGLRTIFDREQGEQREAMVNDFNPVASYLASDVPGIRRGDALQIAMDGEAGVGQMFTVERVSQDGRGRVRVELSSES